MGKRKGKRRGLPRESRNRKLGNRWGCVGFLALGLGIYYMVCVYKNMQEGMEYGIEMWYPIGFFALVFVVGFLLCGYYDMAAVMDDHEDGDEDGDEDGVAE